MARALRILFDAVLLLLLWRGTPANAAPRLLEIYFEENHAGTFYHLASTLPLNEPHSLVLIDAHSDASAILGSDRVRAAIRGVPSEEARVELFAKWRKSGAVQCYDWLEPLMPQPIAEVLWIPARELNPLALARQQTLARESLDGVLEAFPRECGELGPRFRAVDWATFTDPEFHARFAHPVIVSIDLDYFADRTDAELRGAFEEVFARILRIPKLRAITFSLSVPWLRDQAQAERFAYLALDAATNIANARVHYAAFAEAGPDRSLRARERKQRGEPDSPFRVENFGPALRALLLARQKRLAPDARLARQMEEWARNPFVPRIDVQGEVADPDGWHRLRARQPARIRARNSGGGSVRWFASVPEAPSANVADLDLGFAEDAPRILRRMPEFIAEGEVLPAEKFESLLEPTTGAGTVLLYAEIERDGERCRSNELALCFHAETGFRAALSEHFSRPYAFGCGLLPGGPDALIASDCANFVISAFRREGWRIPWGDPKQLAQHLEVIGSWKRGDPLLAISEGDIADGAVVHFGNHVGAVWEDRAPIGELNDADFVAHHLENVPEIVPLGILTKTRPKYQLMRLKRDEGAIRLIFGGDVMLGRRTGEAIGGGANPLTNLHALFSRADWSAVNLECVASEKGVPALGKRYHFRAHPSAPQLLARAGIDAVSLANNHSRDFGDEGFADAIERLRSQGVARVEGTASPVEFEVKGRRFALFGCEDTASPKLLAAIQNAGRDAMPIVIAHWGTEHSVEVGEAQRETAAALVAAGARIIIGSGPHARQTVEFQNGALIAWSLGNLVFDGPGPDLHWSRGTVLEVELSAAGKITRVKQHVVTIAEDGTATVRE